MSAHQDLIRAAIEFGVTKNEIQARQRECFAADRVAADAHEVARLADAASVLAANMKASVASSYAAEAYDRVTEAYRAHSDAAEKLAYEIGRIES